MLKPNSKFKLTNDSVCIVFVFQTRETIWKQDYVVTSNTDPAPAFLLSTPAQSQSSLTTRTPAPSCMWTVGVRRRSFRGG